MALVVCLCFLQCGIPHRTCRFHCCLAAHQRTRKKDSAEPSFAMEPRLRGSLDSTSSTRGIRCGGAYLLPRAWGNLGIRYPVQVAYPQFRIWFGYLCSGWYRSRFSRFCRAYFARFSLLGGWTVRACGYVGFLLWSFVGSALTAIESLVLVDNVMENQIIRSLNRTNAFFQYGSAQPIC